MMPGSGGLPGCLFSEETLRLREGGFFGEGSLMRRRFLCHHATLLCGEEHCVTTLETPAQEAMVRGKLIFFLHL